MTYAVALAQNSLAKAVAVVTSLEASDPREEAIRLAAEGRPDVVLMDLLMPGMGGVEATSRIRQVSPTSQVIVLTSYHDDEHIFPAIRAGALSYLLKTVRPEELADAVRAAAEGRSVLHSPVATRVVQQVRESPPAAEPAAPVQAADVLAEPLSPREMEVLALIAGGHTNKEIAQRLFIAVGTVKRHINNIYGKLQVRHRAEAVARARALNLFD
jgi:DNA-binding NarL/FixJ family response regulator